MPFQYKSLRIAIGSVSSQHLFLEGMQRKFYSISKKKLCRFPIVNTRMARLL